jgi:hypothetical protein
MIGRPPIEYTPNLFAALDSVRKHPYAAPHEHLFAQIHIFEKGHGIQLVPGDEFDLVDPAVGSDGLHERLVKGTHPGQADLAALHRHPPERVHRMGEIDIVGTACRAGDAGCADPYGFRREHPFPLSELDESDQYVRCKIHREGNGTPDCAFPAMEARGDRHSGETLDLGEKGPVIRTNKISGFQA